MIHFYISGQSVRFTSPVIAANSLDYLEAEFHFSGSTWDGCSKWAHFRQGSTVFDLNLLNDRIDAGMHLNLSLGRWEVYVTGTRGESRLTTVPVILTVAESGLIDEPLHQMPQSVAEQIDAKASTALSYAQAVKAAAEAGEYNGADGRSFAILGYYATLEELQSAIALPGVGSVYGVGSSEPYSIYIWDDTKKQWVDNGTIQGPAGDRGSTGATFTPQLDGTGNLSWKNNGGLANPATVNIMGQQGIQGKTGADGKSPYQLAVSEGFTGTKATFNSALAAIAAHGAKHGQDGTDPLPSGSIATDMLAPGAVTAQKLAPGAVATAYSGTLLSSGWKAATAGYTQSVTISGFSAGIDKSKGLIDLDLSTVATAAKADTSDAWGSIYQVSFTDTGLTALCADKPTVDIPVKLMLMCSGDTGGSGGAVSSIYGQVSYNGDTLTIS